MVVAKGTGAPVESLLFNHQCVYLSRKYPLWTGFHTKGMQGKTGKNRKRFFLLSFTAKLVKFGELRRGMFGLL